MRSLSSPPLDWAMGYTRRDPGIVPDTFTANYSLKDLMSKGYIDPEAGQELLDDAGLVDYAWRVTWPESYTNPDEDLPDRFRNVQGYVVFVHGWTGNNTIWEALPGMVVQENRQLVAVSVDHNGFGFSKFANETPNWDSCNPPAAMGVLQRWIDLVRLRRQPGETNRKVVNFVGHSMGGATLFYLNPILWSFGEVTRYALAPALLLKDEMHRAFYTTLGFGINLVNRVRVFELFERFLKPQVILTLAGGASDYVKETHAFQYEVTPRGITGATLMAMGQLRNTEIARDWHLFRVMLGHKDRLVGLVDMMELLGDLEFPAGHIRVVPGTHYMFSVGSESPQNAFQHAQNRELVVEDILKLHEAAIKMQREGHRIG